MEFIESKTEDGLTKFVGPYGIGWRRNEGPGVPFTIIDEDNTYVGGTDDEQNAREIATALNYYEASKDAANEQQVATEQPVSLGDSRKWAHEKGKELRPQWSAIRESLDALTQLRADTDIPVDTRNKIQDLASTISGSLREIVAAFNHIPSRSEAVSVYEQRDELHAALTLMQKHVAELCRRNPSLMGRCVIDIGLMNEAYMATTAALEKEKV